MLRLAFPLALLVTLGLLAYPAQAQSDADWWVPVAPEQMEQSDMERGDDMAQDRRAERPRSRDHQERRGDHQERRGGQGHRGGHQGRRDIPPFCRDGSGHPAHGWAWCVEKGYASAEAPRQAPRPHLRRDQGLSISFRVAYERIFAQGDGLTSADLEVILSRQAMDRFRTQRDRLGAEAPLEGRWVPGRGEASGGVLQLRAGDVPVAELADWNGDGHVDDAFLAERPAR